MSSLGPISAGVTRRYLQISAVVQYLVTPADIWSCRRYRHILCCAAVARYSIAHLCCCTMAVDVVGAMSTMALLTSHVVEKIPFPSRRAHRLPPPPFNPNNTPPPTRSPLPPTFIRRRVMHVFPGEGWGGGQRRCEGAEERDTMATTTTTTTATTLPLPQTERTTSACAVEPKKTTINL